MEKETKNQVCEKCEYYLQHYIKYSVKFRKINCGHCVCPDNNLTKKRFWGDGCIHFQEKQASKVVEQRTLRLTLEFIAKKLDDIASVLTNEIE